jgi:hypothetical protein
MISDPNIAPTITIFGLLLLPVFLKMEINWQKINTSLSQPMTRIIFLGHSLSNLPSYLYQKDLRIVFALM